MSAWIDWHGGNCPVDRKARVDVMWADGSVFLNRNAGEWIWSIDVKRALEHDPDGCGVISAYRLTSKAQPETPA